MFYGIIQCTFFPNAIIQNNSHDQCWIPMKVSSWYYTINIDNGIKELTTGIIIVTLVKS